MPLGRNIYSYVPMPAEEQIVISTSDDSVFAILENTSALPGLYIYVNKHLIRVKISMRNRKITALFQEKLVETPVASKCPIYKKI